MVTGLKGQLHQAKNDFLATIKVQTWCDHSIYIWSCFRGIPDTKNHLKVMDVSSLMAGVFHESFLFEITYYYITSRGTLLVHYCIFYVTVFIPVGLFLHCQNRPRDFRY